MSPVDRGSRQRSVCGHKCAVMMGLRCATEKQITKHKSKWVQAGNKLIYRAGEVSAQLIFFLYVVYRVFSPLCYSVTILTSFLSKRACGTAACCEAVLLTSASSGRCCYVTVAGQPGSQAVVQHGTNHRFQLPVQAQQIHGWERKKAIERERERKSVNSVGIWEEKGSQKKKSLRTLQRRFCTAALR